MAPFLSNHERNINSSTLDPASALAYLAAERAALSRMVFVLIFRFDGAFFVNLLSIAVIVGDTTSYPKILMTLR